MSEHYRLGRMQPFFRPEPLEEPGIRIMPIGLTPSCLGGGGPAEGNGVR